MGFQQSFKALSDPTRREILRLLREKPLPAGEITGHFPTAGATVSHHLAVLKDAGLVLADKRGKYIYYELNTSVVDELLGWLGSLKGGTQHEEPKTTADLGGSTGAAGADGADLEPASAAHSHALES